MAKTSTLGLSSLTSPLNNETTSDEFYQTRNNSYSITSYDDRIHRQQAMPQHVSRYPGHPMTYTNMHQKSVIHERCVRSHSLSSPFACKRGATKDVDEEYCPTKRCCSGMENAPGKSYPESAFCVPESKSPVSDEDALRRYLGAQQAIKHPPPLVKTTSPEKGTSLLKTREHIAISQGHTYRIPPPLVSEANQQEPDQFIGASTTYDNVRQGVTLNQGAYRRYSTSALPQQNNARQSAQLLRRAASYGCGERHAYEKRNNQNRIQECASAFHFTEGYTGYNHDHNLNVDNVHQVQHLKQDYRRSYQPLIFHQEKNEIQVPSKFSGLHVEKRFFQTARHKNNNSLQFRGSIHSPDSRLPSPKQGNLENINLRNHGAYQKTSGLQNFLVNEQGRTPEGHQKSFTFQNNKTAQTHGLSRGQLGRDSDTELNQRQYGLTRNTQSTVLKSKVSPSGAPPPLKRVNSLMSTIGDKSRPNPEELQKVRSPVLIPSRPRSLSVGSKPPPLKRIKDQAQVNHAPTFVTRAIEKNTKENSGPAFEIPGKEKDEQELPDKCGGYAYDHKSLPKIVAVHSFISGDENVLKLIGQQDTVTQTSVTVSMADNRKAVTTGVQSQCHEEIRSDAIVNNGCSDTDDEEVVLTKITRNGHILHSPSSSPRKSGMVDCMCQTTSVSAPTCSDHENNVVVHNHEVATNVTLDSPGLVHGTTTTTADKSLQTPNFQSPPRFQNENMLDELTAHSETKDLPSSPPAVTRSVTTLHEPDLGMSEEIGSGYVTSPLPIKVDSCVQATSSTNVSTKSVAANTTHVNSGNHFVVNQAFYTHAQANNYDFSSSLQTVVAPEDKLFLYPEEQQPLKNCSKVENRKCELDTTEHLNLENAPEESNESPKLLKKRPSTEELCRKITNTRERMKNEKILWKKKVLLRLQMVLVKRLRKTELETGEKASLDIDEISTECFEMLKFKSTHQNNGSKKNEGGKSFKKETECNSQRKPNKHKKVSEVVKGKKKLKQQKNEEAISKENCLKHDSFEHELQVEGGHLNQISSAETKEASQERHSDQVNTKSKDFGEMNSGRGLAVDKNKPSSSHSKMKRAKSYPVQNSTSPIRASQNRQFHRQVSSPEDRSKRETTKPRTSTPMTGGQIRSDATKSNTILAAYSVFSSLKKNRASKNVSSTKASSNTGIKSFSSKYNSASVAIAKQASIPRESQLTNLGDLSNSAPKGVQNIYKSSLQPKSDLQRDNAKKISSWGGAIKPQTVDVFSHNSLPGGSHSVTKYNKVGVKRHWLMSANSF